jgi:hypothetical protein
MRIELPGVVREPEPFFFDFEGIAVPAYAGDTIASALIASGIWGMRETSAGDQRGLFCGMGVCGECSVQIEGETRRGCMEPAHAGTIVRRHCSRAEPRAQPTALPHEVLAPDVLIVGAGPAGLAGAGVVRELDYKLSSWTNEKVLAGNTSSSPALTT